MKYLKSFIFLLIVTFSLFMVTNIVSAEVVTFEKNVCPQYVTAIKNGVLSIRITDNSGIYKNDIKIYKVNQQKVIQREAVVNNVEVKKYRIIKNKNKNENEKVGTEYVYHLRMDELNDSVNYFYIYLKDRKDNSNSSYFLVNKTSSGKFSRQFAPRIKKWNLKSANEVQFNVIDNSRLKSVMVSDMNNGGIVVIKNENLPANSTITMNLNQFKNVNNVYKVTVYTKDENDWSQAHRTYQLKVEVKNSSNNTTNNNKNNNSNNTTNNSTTNNNKSNNTTTNNTASDNTMKVLIIGNSYTYYNDSSGILAELAKKQGRKMIVVNAVHGARDAYCIKELKVSAYYWDNRTTTTTLKKLNENLKLVSGSGINRVKTYDVKLTTAINYDWGNLGRAGKWDYVFLQNHYKGEMSALKKNNISVKTYCNISSRAKRKTYEKKDSESRKSNGEVEYARYSNESNVLIYNMVKNTIPSKNRFVIIRTFAHDWPSHTSENNYMKTSAIENGFSFVDTRMLAKAITGKKTRDRLNNFTIKDGSDHPSARGAYLIGTAEYAKIYGIGDLASSENTNHYIKLFNLFERDFIKKYNKYKDEITFQGAITNALYSNGNALPEAMSVDANYARKIQSTVYKNYSNYIKTFS